jgi:nucleotide-binding universal stress UspA family protein
MDWVVGVDLDEHGGGALGLARFLQRESSGGKPLRIVHALQSKNAPWLVDGHSMAELRGHATERLGEVMTAAKATELGDAEVVEGDPVEVLTELASGEDRGLLIGRLVPRDHDRLVRLGRVARRLLRRLPGPTVIVPPDLRIEELGEGPIVLATDARESSGGAARFAHQLSTRLSRELILVHVVPRPTGWGLAYIPESRVTEIRVDMREAGRRQLEKWAEEHKMARYPKKCTDGWVVEEIARFSEQVDALMIVSGSRRLSAPARVFVSSTSSALASVGRRPVAVVPPDWAGSVSD